MNTATIQLYRAGTWHDAATITLADPAQGVAGACTFAYTPDYVIENLNQPGAAASASCRYPVNFDLRDESTWPAFLLDILPSGAGRRHWLTRLGLKDGASSDWELLLHGAGNPPGNLRIAGTDDRREPIVPTAEGLLVPNREHPGFTRNDILERQEHFIEYAAQNGAHVSGCSDVQGVAPKFLLQQDSGGRWHAEGALAEGAVRACWIVKFPRGRTEDDRKVLRNEAAYMAVAAAVGLRVHHQPTEWEGNTLFIPRFDRIVTNQGIERIGMESLYSLAGVARFGARTSQNMLANALAQFATAPFAELLEFVRRDVLNIALGNKDNHGRNSAILRREYGAVELTPLYDVAPMYLDPEGIARVSRWDDDAEIGGQPVWGKVADLLPLQKPDIEAMRQQLAAWAGAIERLPDTMHACHVDDDIIERRFHSVVEQAKILRDAAPRTTV